MYQIKKLPLHARRRKVVRGGVTYYLSVCNRLIRTRDRVTTNPRAVRCLQCRTGLRRHRKP